MKKIIAAALLLIMGGAIAWLVAARVESPNQVAARAEAPVPIPVSAALHRGYLQGPISLATTAQRQQTLTQKAPAALDGIVTFVNKESGDTLSAGDVLFRANGRPVFVLPGAFALYRDINPEDTGDDVAALQAGLRTAGYGIGRDRSGTFGAGTQAAVRAMYKQAGYVAPQGDHQPSAGTAATMPTTSTAAANPTTPSTVSTSSPSGTKVVSSELIMISNLPSVVQSVVQVGTQLSGDTDLVTLGSGQVVLTATLPTSAVGALSVGATGTFSADDGTAGTGRVDAITADPASAQSTILLSVSGGVTTGANYVLSVDNPAAESGQSLLAPVAAVVSRGGRSYIYRLQDNVFTEVEVSISGTAGGIAAILPADPAVSLDENTQVRVG